MNNEIKTAGYNGALTSLGVDTVKLSAANPGLLSRIGGGVKGLLTGAKTKAQAAMQSFKGPGATRATVLPPAPSGSSGATRNTILPPPPAAEAVEKTPGLLARGAKWALPTVGLGVGATALAHQSKPDVPLQPRQNYGQQYEPQYYNELPIY